MKLTISSVLICSSLLSACAGFVPTVVSESDRDTQNTYDGRWSLTVAPRNKVPKGERNQFYCKIDENTSILSVQDGIARIEGEQSDIMTNVSTEGKFRLEMPTDQNFRKKSGLTGFNSRLTIIYKGTLSDDGSTGVFVHGRGTAKKTDCSTIMSIQKLS